MEVGDFIHNAWVHIRGVLLGAVLGGLLAAALSLTSASSFTSTSTLRVVPPAGALDTDLLSTAVEWYAALGDVPAVLDAASASAVPAVDTTTMREQSSLAPGVGPGEIIVTATAPDEQQAVSMNNALGSSLVQIVNKDEELQLGGTQLRVLLPAEGQGQMGSGAVTLFVTGLLAGFLVLFTAAGLLHRFINWRVNGRILRALGSELQIPVFTATADLALMLVQQGRIGGQTWMAATPGIPDSAVESLRRQTEHLGGPVDLVVIADSGERPPADGHTVYLPEPNDASPSALSAVSLASSPAAVLVVARSRSRQVRATLTKLRELGIPVLALGLMRKQKATTRVSDPDSA